MSPNGTLLAYSRPANIKELRDQAALVSMAWKEHEHTIRSETTHFENHDSSASSRAPLETLTIEFDNGNLIVRAIQPKLLLVLVGGVPPGRKQSFKVTPEIQGSARYPPEASYPSSNGHDKVIPPASTISPNSSQDPTSMGSPDAPSSVSVAESHMSQREKDTKLGPLYVQRKKVDAMTDFIRQDFDRRGFVMPDDVSFP
ncbi:hypothetical protein IWX91DRAFT_327592 [Phyllosticta citricarpa]